jgi:hypothetical protein
LAPHTDVENFAQFSLYRLSWRLVESISKVPAHLAIGPGDQEDEQLFEHRAGSLVERVIQCGFGHRADAQMMERLRLGLRDVGGLTQAGEARELSVEQGDKHGSGGQGADMLVSLVLGDQGIEPRPRQLPEDFL